MRKNVRSTVYYDSAWCSRGGGTDAWLFTDLVPQGTVTVRERTYKTLSLANIQTFEYTIVVSDSLRRFKAEIFQALAHPTRIAIVELLRDGPLPAGKLIEQLGIEQANASQHLSVLRSKQIVLNRKEGNQVFYSLRDPILSEVLALMRHYFQTHIAGSLAQLGQIEKEEVAGR